MTNMERDHNKENTRLYNLLLPLWIIVFAPSWLWLILIPANYLIDRVVLKWSLGDMPDKGLFCRKHNWKICLAGFLSDFIGALLLLAVTLGSSLITVLNEENASVSPQFIEDIMGGLMANPFANIGALMVTLASIALAGLCIYLIDRKILKKAGLDFDQAKHSAIRLALITAPYLYLIPSKWLYSGGLF